MLQSRRHLVAILILLLVPALSAAAEIAAPGLLGRFKEYAVGLGLLLALPAAFLAARKALVAYLGREIPHLLRKLLDAGDEADDALVYALARWAERKAAQAGQAGPARLQVVAAGLCARLKVLRGQEARLADLLAAAVEAAGKAAAGVADEQPAGPPLGPPPAA